MDLKINVPRGRGGKEVRGEGVYSTYYLEQQITCLERDYRKFCTVLDHCGHARHHKNNRCNQTP